MTGIEPELWVDRAGAAVTFYERAFSATTVLRVGDGDDLLARLQVGEARFWVAPASEAMGRFSPAATGGRTGRTLLIVDDPVEVVRLASDAGATVTAPVGKEHGWLLGRIVDPAGHEWEIGHPADG